MIETQETQYPEDIFKNIDLSEDEDAIGGHSITTWTRWGGGGQKMSVFVHAQDIKTVHAGGSKND